MLFSDTIDFVKQSAALCLLKLFLTSQDNLPLSEYSVRIVHLLNDNHLVKKKNFRLSLKILGSCYIGSFTY